MMPKNPSMIHPTIEEAIKKARKEGFSEEEVNEVIKLIEEKDENP